MGVGANAGFWRLTDFRVILNPLLHNTIIAILTKVGAGTFSCNVIIIVFIFLNLTTPTHLTSNASTTQHVTSL